MAQAPETEIVVRYTGAGSGAHEIWGGTQANFLVAIPGWPGAREVAVMLNDPGAALLAESVGAENSDEFRHDAARRVGEAAIRERYARGGHIDAVITVSRATLEEHPALIEALRS